MSDVPFAFVGNLSAWRFPDKRAIVSIWGLLAGSNAKSHDSGMEIALRLSA
jgi:hypothetical protein